MPSPAQLVADLSGLQSNARLQRIEDARLAYAGVSGKGRYLARNQLLELVDALSGLGAHFQRLVACPTVEGGQFRSGSQIALVHAHDALAVVSLGNGDDPVDEEGVGYRNGLGCNDDQLVDVGHGGPGKLVFPGQDGVQSSLAVIHGREFHPVPHQRGNFLVAQLASSPAGGDGATAVVHIVETAQGLKNDSFHQLSKSTVWSYALAPSIYTVYTCLPVPFRSSWKPPSRLVS